MKWITELKQGNETFTADWKRHVAQDFDGDEVMAAVVLRRQMGLSTDFTANESTKEARLRELAKVSQHCAYCKLDSTIGSGHWYVTFSPRYKEGFFLRCKKQHSETRRKPVTASGPPPLDPDRRPAPRPPTYMTRPGVYNSGSTAATRLSAPNPDAMPVLEELLNLSDQQLLLLRKLVRIVG